MPQSFTSTRKKGPERPPKRPDLAAGVVGKGGGEAAEKRDGGGGGVGGERRRGGGGRGRGGVAEEAGLPRVRRHHRAA